MTPSAIAKGDIVIVTMLFLEAHIEAVRAALADRCEACDAMICCMSAPEIMRLTRMGRFRMDKEATGALALLKRLRGGGDKTGRSAGAQQMSMLRRLPRLLRFIPGTAQDVRAYFLTLQYWLAGSDRSGANDGVSDKRMRAMLTLPSEMRSLTSLLSSIPTRVFTTNVCRIALPMILS